MADTPQFDITMARALTAGFNLQFNGAASRQNSYSITSLFSPIQTDLVVSFAGVVVILVSYTGSLFRPHNGCRWGYLLTDHSRRY